MIGAVLAGGAGRRLGRGSKAAVQVRGRALVSWPLEALAAVCERVAVVCKHGTGLPELSGVERWNEPDHSQHPLIGITHALERAGEPVLVCAADMPWVTADSCRSLVNAAGAGDGAPAVAVAGGVLQPVFAVYSPVALDTLRGAGSDASLTATIELLNPVRVALPPPLVRSVDTAEDLGLLESGG